MSVKRRRKISVVGSAARSKGGFKVAPKGCGPSPGRRNHEIAERVISEMSVVTVYEDLQRRRRSQHHGKVNIIKAGVSVPVLPIEEADTKTSSPRASRRALSPSSNVSQNYKVGMFKAVTKKDEKVEVEMRSGKEEEKKKGKQYQINNVMPRVMRGCYYFFCLFRLLR